MLILGCPLLSAVFSQIAIGLWLRYSADYVVVFTSYKYVQLKKKGPEQKSIHK